MDRIEPRIHDEFRDYKEKFYNFTIRQWLFGILIVIIVVPMYLFLSPIIGSDITGWLVILVAMPLAFFGFIPIQNMNAEKIIFYWKRNYINFAKPLTYKTKEELLQEKNRKKHKSGLSKKEKFEIKKSRKEEKLRQIEIKKERQKQRDIARAKKKFGLNTIQNNNSGYSLSEEETKALLKFVQNVVGKENKTLEKEDIESSTKTETEKEET